jgi:hypothetical protein
MSGQLAEEKQGKQPASIQEEIYARRAAIEQGRKDQEKERTEYLKTGKGKSPFAVTTNRETVERYTAQDGAPKSVEDYDDKEREDWLRGAPPLPKETKPNGKPAAKKEEEQQAADAAASNEGETSKEGDEPKWTKEAHEERFTKLQNTTIKQLAAEKDANGKSVVERIMLPKDLTPQLTHYFLRVVADMRSPDAVLRALADGSSGLNLSDRAYWGSERGVRELQDDLLALDRKISRGARNGNSNGAERKEDRTLTRAGRPPMQADGNTSSPADDGSSDAAWRRKDLSREERGELYRKRKDEEEIAARRKRYGRGK